MDSTGTLEDQLTAVQVILYSVSRFTTRGVIDWLVLQARANEIHRRKDALRKVEEFGAQTEEALIFDNKLVKLQSYSVYDVKGQLWLSN